MFRFPCTNFHELNLDWILNKVKELDKKVKQLIETGGGGAEPYDGTPANLGTAAPGSSNQFARGDHVHAKPSYTASDVGAVALPVNPSTGDFMMYDGVTWTAQSIQMWNGGDY